MIMSNAKNWKPCEDRGVFSFITIFTNSFKFITKCRVNLQQNHQGAKVRRNAIILSSRGINFQTSAHLSWFGIFITKMLRQCQIYRWLWNQFFIQLYNLRLVRHGHTRHHNFEERKRDLQSKLNRQWMCGRFVTLRCMVVIYKSMKRKEVCK